MWLVWEQCGVSLREIGDFFGGLNYAAVAQRLRRLTSEDKQEAARIHTPDPIFAFPGPLNVCACVHIGQRQDYF